MVKTWKKAHPPARRRLFVFTPDQGDNDANSFFSNTIGEFEISESLIDSEKMQLLHPYVQHQVKIPDHERRFPWVSLVRWRRV
jgi:hypothetical protein